MLIGRFGLLVGAFLVLAGALSALLNPPGTAEFVISVVTVGLGLLNVVLGLLAVLLERKRHP
ncbi:membrane protein [Nocardiopsis sp. NRRL B-16309]|nr:membrane protein [Nocardiopsis sp. NRRL B-16309]